MATSDGPSIIKNGLVLCLDAADKNSYPGSGTVWFDLSGNNNNGVLVNSPTYTSSNGGSFNFDEINDYVSCGNLLNNNEYTKIAWFRPESSCANIISGGGEATHAFWMAGTDHTLYAGHAGVYNIVNYRPNPSGNMLNKWWFGAVTFNTVIGWVLYLNGVIVNTNASTTSSTGTGKIRIAAFNDAANLFDGDIASCSLYNRSLSSSEVFKNYNALKSRFGL
jgi:hypothetical protein